MQDGKPKLPISIQNLSTYLFRRLPKDENVTILHCRGTELGVSLTLGGVYYFVHLVSSITSEQLTSITKGEVREGNI